MSELRKCQANPSRLLGPSCNHSALREDISVRMLGYAEDMVSRGRLTRVTADHYALIWRRTQAAFPHFEEADCRHEAFVPLRKATIDQFRRAIVPSVLEYLGLAAAVSPLQNHLRHRHRVNQLTGHGRNDLEAIAAIGREMKSQYYTGKLSPGLFAIMMMGYRYGLRAKNILDMRLDGIEARCHEKKPIFVLRYPDVKGQLYRCKFTVVFPEDSDLFRIIRSLYEDAELQQHQTYAFHDGDPEKLADGRMGIMVSERTAGRMRRLIAKTFTSLLPLETKHLKGALHAFRRYLVSTANTPAQRAALQSSLELSDETFSRIYTQQNLDHYRTVFDSSVKGEGVIPQSLFRLTESIPEPLRPVMRPPWKPVETSTLADDEQPIPAVISLADTDDLPRAGLAEEPEVKHVPPKIGTASAKRRAQRRVTPYVEPVVPRPDTPGEALDPSQRPMLRSSVRFKPDAYSLLYERFPYSRFKGYVPGRKLNWERPDDDEQV